MYNIYENAKSIGINRKLDCFFKSKYTNDKLLFYFCVSIPDLLC